MDVYSPTRDELRLVDILHALSDPVRLHIVRALDRASGPLSCSEIDVPVVKSTASHHYKVLREAGITRAEVEGTRRFHVLRRDDLDARFPGLLDAVLNAGDREPTNIA
jgi:DNA-binding transcriptional ArsR family regulator